MRAATNELIAAKAMLVELLSDPGFVALLRTQGFTAMPELVRRFLMEGR
ncbi:hypothetical protein [Paraburkholderia sp. DHOC27]|nr:hypothetical protein [Paraburkholderia sp. DHOC27]